MDFGNTSRIVAPTGAATIPRADIVATRGSVPVELPPEQTVQSAPAGEALKLDIRQDPDSHPAPPLPRQDNEASEQAQQEMLPKVLDRSLSIDAATRTIILEKKDPDTGETVETLPDELALRARRANQAFIERARAHDGETPARVERRA
ncbi:conserved hypothetical protein [Hyphomicrobiales bacterium]|nr:conserved hypothetical protein [Hyphomicrobiales bacterium]CAH1700138.1 conserved hypothetical protein [Hyphomicrobiales bacterium]CAI0343900.1 conserved hypothetical protein [Hyphomicrobiales bacterium]